MQDHADHAGKHQPHEKSEAEQDKYSQRGILRFFNGKETAIANCYHYSPTEQWAAIEEAEIDLNAEPSSKNRRNHRESQKPISISQYSMANVQRVVAVNLPHLIHIASKFNSRVANF